MRYPVTFEVKEIRGTCPLHQVGDRVTISMVAWKEKR
jgi:hypothetical protein